MPEHVLQWNMDFFDESKISKSTTSSRLAVLKRLIADVEPTLIALQEAPSSCLKVLANAGYGRIGTTGLVLGYRLTDWLSPTLLPVLHKRLQCVGLERSNGKKKVLVTNLHLLSRKESSSEKHRHDEARDKVVKLRDLRKDKNLSSYSEIIIGDFNLILLNLYCEKLLAFSPIGR